ncbi:hypothetical protein Hokovirus_2_66 [Hokovirus HKV1]|uniref:UvrD-like helicase C-terminal domain-containing protein n=1 Tax=Hokovirus HKV1 TaxID=1977638 RepID=A0A1V0SFN9_9VIRU|nr:hypothetical protein Hokovirus_2_66 [Hokovirus HKV1]
MLLDKVSKKIVSNEYMIILGNFYDSLIRNINDNIIDLIPTFKLQVVKLSNGEEQIDKIYTIYTLDHDTKQLINNKMINIKSNMKHFENTIKKKFTDVKAITYLEKNILIPLWADINNIYINKFAQISISYSTTTNKSQSSTYCNVFVDIDNMLSNKNILDAKKCIYTAISRASHRVHLLI